jgi:hypothetical protein
VEEPGLEALIGVHYVIETRGMASQKVFDSIFEVAEEQSTFVVLEFPVLHWNTSQ